MSSSTTTNDATLDKMQSNPVPEVLLEGEQMAPNSLSNTSEPSQTFGYQATLSDGGEFMSDTELNTRYNHPKRRWMHNSNEFNSLSRHTKSTDNSENSLYSKASLPLTPFSNQVSFQSFFPTIGQILIF